MSDQFHPSDKQLEDGIIYTQKKALLDQLQRLEASLPKINTALPWYQQRRWKQISLAAAVAGIALLVWWLQDAPTTSGPHAAIADYFEPIPHPRGAERDEGQDLEERAVIAYLQEDYEQAAPLFETLVRDQKDSLSLLYLGISQLGSGDAEGAIGSINQFLVYDSSTYEDKPYYYLALAHVQLGEMEEAKGYAARIKSPELKNKVDALLSN